MILTKDLGQRVRNLQFWLQVRYQIIIVVLFLVREGKADLECSRELSIHNLGRRCLTLAIDHDSARQSDQ